MNQKTHPLLIKSFSENGFFEGYASVFHVVDLQKDILMPGAFQKSIQSHQKLKMLWQHDMQTPIGFWHAITEDQYGLYVKGQLLLDLPKAKEAYTLLKAGVLDGLSIGFHTVESHFDEQQKATVISQVDLVEISVVTFAANPDAKITNIKTHIDCPQTQIEKLVLQTERLQNLLNTPIF